MKVGTITKIILVCSTFFLSLSTRAQEVQDPTKEEIEIIYDDEVNSGNRISSYLSACYLIDDMSVEIKSQGCGWMTVMIINSSNQIVNTTCFDTSNAVDFYFPIPISQEEYKIIFCSSILRAHGYFYAY